MAPSFYLSYIRSTPAPAPPPPLVPSPLRIFKRPSRNPSITNPPLATLASPLPESSLASTDSHSKSSPASPPSIYYSSTDLPLPAASPTPSSISLTTTNSSACDLCLKPLSPLQKYSFPQTAPAVTDRVRRLFPTVESASPTFCSPCFEAIHAVHICWGCGFPIYREEERVGCGWAWWHWGCMKCLLCRTPLPPPPWTDNTITLPLPPSCKACTRELQHLAYQERSRSKRRTSSQQQLLQSSSLSSYDGASSRNLSLITNNKPSLVPIRKTSLGVKYPPLPKWMQKRIPGPTGGGERRPSVPRWMDMLPGNMKGLRRKSGRVGSGGGAGPNGRVGKGGWRRETYE